MGQPERALHQAAMFNPIFRRCGSRNSVMLIDQHLHVGVVVRQNWRVYRDRLSGEHGVVRMPETIIFPER